MLLSGDSASLRFCFAFSSLDECDRDFSLVERSLLGDVFCRMGYFLPAANAPRLPGSSVMTSGPLVFPVMIGLFATVSYA